MRRPPLPDLPAATPGRQSYYPAFALCLSWLRRPLFSSKGFTLAKRYDTGNMNDKTKRGIAHAYAFRVIF